jgi:hypothetical protein
MKNCHGIRHLETEGVQDFGGKTWEERDHLESLGVDGSFY